jgi:hypothetical protein
MSLWFLKECSSYWDEGVWPTTACPHLAWLHLQWSFLQIRSTVELLVCQLQYNNVYFRVLNWSIKKKYSSSLLMFFFCLDMLREMIKWYSKLHSDFEFCTSQCHAIYFFLQLSLFLFFIQGETFAVSTESLWVNPSYPSIWVLCSHKEQSEIFSRKSNVLMFHFLLDSTEDRMEVFPMWKKRKRTNVLPR